MTERAELIEQINTRNTAVAESMRRQLEEDLRERELMLRELERQKRMAESGMEAKARFIANISHEIRTPMNGVFGMLDLLSSTHLTEDQRELLDTARSSADWLLTLINDVLHFSKIEAGGLQFEEIDFDVRECITWCINLLRPKASEACVKLTFNIEEPIPWALRGDPARLRQVLVNLTGNAIKFTPKGEVHVAARYDLDETRLDVTVKDTGIGISPSQQAVIFDPFSQADSSTTRRFGGTGLGLSISREIVWHLGGDLWVESEVGVGSTFGFSVVLPPGGAPSVEEVHSTPEVTPAPLIAEPALPATEASDQADRSAAESDGRRRVLIVEDNAVNQKLACRFLERAGYRADVAHNGAEGVARFVDGTYDIILMDCQMPVMNGFEASRKIRAIESGKGPVPIIALTASALPEDRARCFEAGMNEVLTKPVQYPRLARILDQFLTAG